MVKTIIVRSRTSPQLIYLGNKKELRLKAGDGVVFKSEKNEDIGLVKKKTRKKVSKIDGEALRIATAEDWGRVKEIEKEEKELSQIFLKGVERYGLTMKLITTKVFFDGQKVIFYYTSPTRIDFRAFLQDCIRQIPKLIRFEQIGVRSAAKMLGGVGVCGQSLCCHSFLENLKPVFVEQTETLNLSKLGRQKLYGPCGKLMCCLNFEGEAKKPLKFRFKKLFKKKKKNTTFSEEKNTIFQKKE